MGKGSGDGCRPAMALQADDDGRDERLYMQVRGWVSQMGFPAWATVGGCERDRVLGRPLKDVDVMVAGVTADELLEICRHHGRGEYLEVGGRLVGVRMPAPWSKHEHVELALARTEVSTGLGFHDFDIVPIDPPAELLNLSVSERGARDPAGLRDAMLRDLHRRDFTCNAIAVTADGETLDPFGGREDLERGVIRAVSDDTFRDDPLRCFRLVARMGKDGLTPDEHTDMLLRPAARNLRALNSADLKAGDLRLLRARLEVTAAGSELRDVMRPDAYARVADVFADISGADDQQIRDAADTLRDPSSFNDKTDAVDLYDTPLAAERIRDELDKMFGGDHAADALRYARDTGLLTVMFPHLQPSVGFDQRSKYHDLTVDEHLLAVSAHAVKVGAPPQVRLAALLHDAEKPSTAHEGKAGNLSFYGKPPGQPFAGAAAGPDSVDVVAVARRELGGDATVKQVRARAKELREAVAAGDINPVGMPGRSHEDAGAESAARALRRLRYENDTVNKVQFLVANHMYRDDENFAARKPADQQRRARRFIARVGRDNVEDLMLLRRCDRAGKSRDAAAQPGWDHELSVFEQVVRSQMRQPVTVADLAVDGRDVMQFGVKGPKIGEILEQLRGRVTDNPEHNQRERLLGWVEKLAS